jgi:glutamate dehydrogenase (NADP+)
MLGTTRNDSSGKRVISGSGNVAQYAAEKLLELGGQGPVTFSDSSGYIVDEEGIDREKLAYLMNLKNTSAGAG